jgi:N-acetylglutamate synthase-like GNAT family acetyltransferase
MNVSRISFDELKSYWIEVDHFKVPNKKIREVVRQLGPYKCEMTDPRRFSYGLYDGEELVGVTHLVQWSDQLVRYRTLNVRRSHRGRGLGSFLLTCAINMDWKSSDHDLFGWIRRDHQAWAKIHGFKPLDGSWHDNHIAMTKPLSDF